MAKETKVTDKTRKNAVRAALSVHSQLVGLVTMFRANGLDEKPVEKAVKALQAVVADLEREVEVRIAAKQAYHESVGSVTVSELSRLRQENEDLKKRLAAQ